MAAAGGLPSDPVWKRDYSGSVRRLVRDGVDVPLAKLVAVMFRRNSGFASLGLIVARMPIERTRILVRAAEPLRAPDGLASYH